MDRIFSYLYEVKLRSYQIIFLFTVFIGSCKGNQSGISGSDPSENPTIPGPGDLNPDEAIMDVMVKKLSNDYIYAQLIKLGKQGFGFNASVKNGDELLLKSANDWKLEIGEKYTLQIEQLTEIGDQQEFKIIKIIE